MIMAAQKKAGIAKLKAKWRASNARNVLRSMTRPSPREMELVNAGIMLQEIPKEFRPGQRRLMFETIKKGQGRVLISGQNEKLERARLRMAIKYALDGINFRGPKRKLVFEEMQKVANDANFRQSQGHSGPRPKTIMECERKINQILGRKAELFFRLVDAKTDTITSYQEYQWKSALKKP
jgi:hypothetical protein